MHEIGKAYRSLLMGVLVCCTATAMSTAKTALAQIVPLAAPGQEKPADAPSALVANDKMIYLFYKRSDISREEYQRKYVELHAPLGMQYTRNLFGYTVNLTASEGGPDAVTEIWVRSAIDTLAGRTAITPRLPEDAARTVADDKARGGRMLGFIVEENVLRGGPITAEVGRTPGEKTIRLYHRGEQVPPPPSRAWRVVDNSVLHNPDGRAGADGKWKEGQSDIVLIRMAWFAGEPDAEAASGDALIAREWRFRPSPWK